MITAEKPSTPIHSRILTTTMFLKPLETAAVHPNTGIMTVVDESSAMFLFPLDDEGSKLGLVDGGKDRNAESLNAHLALLGKRITDIELMLITHVHEDHVGAAEKLGALGVPIFVSQEDRAVILGERRSEGPVQNFLDAVAGGRGRPLRASVDTLNPTLLKNTESLSDEECLKLGSVTIRALRSPGHTEGSVSFVISTPKGDALAVGDALDTGRGNRLRLPPKPLSGDMEMANKTMDFLSLFASRYPSMTVYSGHSGSTTGEAIASARRNRK